MDSQKKQERITFYFIQAFFITQSCIIDCCRPFLLVSVEMNIVTSIEQGDSNREYEGNFFFLSIIRSSTGLFLPSLLGNVATMKRPMLHTFFPW